MSAEPSKFQGFLKAFALMTTISSYFVGSVLLGIFIGRWLDKQFHTEVAFLVTGLLLGLGVAVTGIIIAIRRFLGGSSRE
ncbi:MULTISPECIES: AtpZ/AtpI family protein [Bacillaceae]|uniref:AtpZ/AtpI family protein n=1 Tax=Evansella alkalicola TaxID=745819 RepID=A0ABS6K0J7_9BACI|nr:MULTISPECIES: AtpZ/AtpI family protein [Bacillaceae]MBU9724374.1 AtpZ/AtpI family protein [Bacillus alkalicola]